MPSSCCLRKDLPCALGTIAPMSWRLCGSWKVCGPSGTWNWARRAQIDLHHCSPGETVRGECGRSVAHCCLIVKIVIWVQQVLSMPSCYRTCFFLWNHSLRTQTNLHHCSPEETVRGECVAWVAKCCFSVNIVRSCRDIGEMQWNSVSSRPSWYRTCFGSGIIHCVHFFFDWFQFVNISLFAHLCLEVRSYTASWYRAYLLCQTPESCFQFRSERADASHWIVCYTFFLP